MPTDLPNDISLPGFNYSRAQEGRALRAYQDSVGVWTIGYGLTNYDKGLPWKVAKGLTITEDQAEWYLLKSMRENYLPAVKRALDGGTYQHPQGAIDGGVDFHLNTGGIAKATWPKALGRGDLAAAKTSLESWNKAGGKVLSGLTRRRAGNWLEVSQEDYGKLAGPAIVVPNASNHEVIQGTGDLLTAFPADPGDTSAGSVKIDGPTVPTTEAPGVLKVGMSGPAVVEAQTDLTNAGYPVTATGIFNQATAAAVHAFQSAHPNLTPDGKIGPATRAAVSRAIDMRGTVAVVAKTAAPSIPTAYIAFHQFMSAHAGNIALAVGVGALVVAAGYVLWKHRHDASGWFNSVIGRAVA